MLRRNYRRSWDGHKSSVRCTVLRPGCTLEMSLQSFDNRTIAARRERNAPCNEAASDLAVRSTVALQVHYPAEECDENQTGIFDRHQLGNCGSSGFETERGPKSGAAASARTGRHAAS